MDEFIKICFAENIKLHQLSQDYLVSKISSAILKTADCVRAGGTIFWAGNGGSAADAQHMAAELIGRFKKERKPIKSIALTCNSSILTAIGNDYSYDLVFCRQLEAFAKKNDVLIVMSTSGNSKNIIEVAKLGKRMGVLIVALTGETGGELAQYADVLINVPSKETARVQEVHLLIEHTVCEAIENIFASQTQTSAKLVQPAVQQAQEELHENSTILA